MTSFDYNYLNAFSCNISGKNKQFFTKEKILKKKIAALIDNHLPALLKPTRTGHNKPYFFFITRRPREWGGIRASTRVL